MESYSGEAEGLVDLWSDSPEYSEQYQQPSEIEQTIGLLDLQNAEALLDAGCGNGAFVLSAARRFPHLRACAIDALLSAIEACRAAGGAGLEPRLQMAVGRVERLALPDADVDRVLCRAVLHHLPAPELAYSELARVTRPGGRLLLQAPCNYWDPAFGQVLRDLFSRIDPSHERSYHRPSQVIAGLSDHSFGLRRAECWPYDFPFLDDAQADFLRRAGAAERVELHKTGDGTWCVRLRWLRVLAERL